MRESSVKIVKDAIWNHYESEKLSNRSRMTEIYKMRNTKHWVSFVRKVLWEDLIDYIVFTQWLKHEVNKLVEFQYLSIVLCDDLERKVLIQISLCYAIKLGIYWLEKKQIWVVNSLGGMYSSFILIVMVAVRTYDRFDKKILAKMTKNGRVTYILIFN